MLATMLSTSASSTVQQLTREPQLCIFIDILRVNYCAHCLNCLIFTSFSIKKQKCIMPAAKRQNQILRHLCANMDIVHLRKSFTP